MTDNAWLSYPPPEADVHQYQAWVAEQGRGLISDLGAGCCPECGRPWGKCECWEDDRAIVSAEALVSMATG